MYEFLADVPEPIRDFYIEVTDLEAAGNPVAVSLIPRTEIKHMGQLERVIAKGKQVSVVEKFASMVALGEWWKGHDDYRDWMLDCIDLAVGAASIVRATNEAGQFIGDDLETADENEAWVGGISPSDHMADIKPEPVVRPLQSVNQLLIGKGYYTDNFKSERSAKVEKIVVEVDGVKFDGDEVSQNRLVRAAFVMLAQKFMAIESALDAATLNPEGSIQDFLTDATVKLAEAESTIQWRTADDKTEVVTGNTIIKAAMLAGQEQSSVWMPE